MKILNLYAGIGGNRKNWNGEKHDITTVEINEEIAEVYHDNFSKDKVVVGCAHQYLKENYQDFDFIWASPPCPTHSRIRKAGAKNGQYEPKYADMKLWQEIIFLDNFFEGDWVVENVRTYYEPMIKPQRRNHHFFWSNFSIPEPQVGDQIHNNGNVNKWQEYYGFDLSDYGFETVKKRKILRNCVHPKVGEAILQARSNKQSTLATIGDQS